MGLDSLDLCEGDLADDNHPSEKGTKAFLRAIRDFVKDDIGVDIVGDMPKTSRTYAGQKKHYKFGCAKCTFLHAGATCPTFDEDDDDEDDDDERDDAEAAEAGDDASEGDTSSRSRKKKRRSPKQQHQRASGADASSPELPGGRRSLALAASPGLTEAAAVAAAEAALASMAAASSFAAAVTATPSRSLPAEPSLRTRSTSNKRGSDGERCDSQKRQKTETELELAIKRNRDLLVEGGMDASKQDNLWKAFKGVQLLNKQKVMIQKMCNTPGNKLSGKGGHR